MCVVTADDFDWGDDAPPLVPLAETVVYEVHVKGFTQLHPDVPEEIRGTYAGLAHPAAIAHLVDLGVTSVELMPVHQFVQDSHLLEKGLSNYWGYNSIGFLAPHGAYSSAGDTGGQVNEFKAMVKAFHAAGLEVILDVVYNHTAEGNDLGPTLSFKAIDNEAYYRLLENDEALLLRLRRARQQPQHAPPPRRWTLIMDSCATGWPRCTSTASASTWPVPR